MKKLGLALCLLLGIAPAQAQNFSMPPPAGVIVGGFNVVASCAGQSLLTTKPAFGTIDTTGALCVNATVSASVTGFTPNGNFATLTSAASSADAALPVGTTDLLQNTGTSAVSCNLTVGAGTSTASKIIIAAGATEGVVVGSNTHYSCINQAGDSASNVVVAAGGAGLATTFSGGGGGGSGGAVTVASGADVAEGSIGDAAWVSGNGTTIALLKAAVGGINGAIAAGANVIGKVGIDQTTPGTTNAVYSNQVSQYPVGATVYSASATGTTGATTATLAGASSVITYLCGFSIRANAAAAATGNATVTGTITGTLNFTQWTAPNASGLGVTEEIFTPCLPASGINQSVAVVSAAPGTGGVVSVSAWGYKL